MPFADRQNAGILAAALSLLLWISLVAAGRWIGYWEPAEAA